MNKTRDFMAIIAAFSISTQAAGNGAEGSAPPAKAGMGSEMSMMDMTSKARGECMMVSDSLGGLLKTVQDARKSNDKAKMKTALQRVEDHISAMKNHIGQCMDMMGNMMGGNKMQDGMMGTGMKSGGMMNPDSAQASQMPNKGNKVDHEKHHSK